jgi:hypothetical protein
MPPAVLYLQVQLYHTTPTLMTVTGPAPVAQVIGRCSAQHIKRAGLLRFFV